jgi:hypothetical protein
MYTRGIDGGITMLIDPVVQEVRKAGEKLAEKANYDLHTFFQFLRENERKRKSKVVSRVIKEDRNKKIRSGIQKT